MNKIKQIPIKHNGFDSLKKYYNEIEHELQQAEKKHPLWPDDIIHSASILVEEAGEALKAANEVYYEKGSIQELKTEIYQTGAMVLRLLMYLDYLEKRQTVVNCGSCTHLDMDYYCDVIEQNIPESEWKRSCEDYQYIGDCNYL